MELSGPLHCYYQVNHSWIEHDFRQTLPLFIQFKPTFELMPSGSCFLHVPNHSFNWAFVSEFATWNRPIT